MSGDSPKYNPDAHADVCLLLEGTYPYVRGGVSTWVKQLIEGMQDLSFSIIFLGASPDDYDKPAYEIPDNVVHIEIHYLMGSDSEPAQKKKLFARKADKAALFDRNQQLHDMLTDSEQQGKEVPPEAVRDFTSLTTGKDAITRTDLFHSDESWNAIRSKYDIRPRDRKNRIQVCLRYPMPSSSPTRKGSSSSGIQSTWAKSISRSLV